MSICIHKEASEIQFGLNAVSEILSAFAKAEDTPVPCSWLSEQLEKLSERVDLIISASLPGETK